MGRIPIMTVLLNSKVQVQFYCPFCFRYHFHGCDSNLRKGKLSHRSSHCENEYLSKHGYYLKLASKKSVEATINYGYRETPYKTAS